MTNNRQYYSIPEKALHAAASSSDAPADASCRPLTCWWTVSIDEKANSFFWSASASDPFRPNSISQTKQWLPESRRQICLRGVQHRGVGPTIFLRSKGWPIPSRALEASHLMSMAPCPIRCLPLLPAALSPVPVCAEREYKGCLFGGWGVTDATKDVHSVAECLKSQTHHDHHE